MIEPKAEQPRTRFRVGTRVRAKNHVMDPDYPDLPLGGWTGRVADVQKGTVTNCLVRWSPETLQSVHPIYRNRCERDDFCLDRTRLLEEDLELNRGGCLSIEHPVHVVLEGTETFPSRASVSNGTTSGSVRKRSCG